MTSTTVSNNLKNPLSVPHFPKDEESKQVNHKHIDEFNAPNCLVATVLTAESAGVVRNGVSIPIALVRSTSSAATSLRWVAAPSYCLTGAITIGFAAVLLPGCYSDFKGAMNSNSTEEKWRSSLNLLDKCLLLAIGFALCFIGALSLATLITAAKTSVASFAALAIPIGSTVFASLVTLRGLEMLLRGQQGLQKANQFQKDFQEHIENDAFSWLLQQKEQDPAALKNRIGEKAFNQLNEAASQQELLESVDTGICEERTKQQLFLAVGTAMLLGGILALLSIGCSHTAVSSAVVTALGIAGSSFSLSMEALWMPYDNPKWFKKLVDWNYRKHQLRYPLPWRKDQNLPDTPPLAIGEDRSASPGK